MCCAVTAPPVSGGKSDSQGGEPVRQTLAIRLFHCFFLVVIAVKLWSGFAISFPLAGFPDLYWARLTHALMTPLLAALLALRLYLALPGRGWRDLLVYRRHELREIGPWLRHYLFLAGKPPQPHKYNVIQRLLFTGIFISMPPFFASGVVMLHPPPQLAWLTLLFGSQASARLVHYLSAVLLAAIIAIHIYMGLTVGNSKLRAMFSLTTNRRKRA